MADSFIFIYFYDLPDIRGQSYLSFFAFRIRISSIFHQLIVVVVCFFAFQLHVDRNIKT